MDKIVETMKCGEYWRHQLFLLKYLEVKEDENEVLNIDFMQ
jgi:hypothetical protein